ncbi:MAG: methionyl-tRNA formyltransferase [Planctomycetota bacterium]|jgi:methionyl-tRNA formyltransferase
MTTRPLRTVFMGTPEIAVPALRILAERTTVTCVVTQPDRPAGRGKHLRPPPVKTEAAALGLPLWQPATLRDAAGDPRLHGADVFVVMAYGELLRQAVLDLPAACINLHASLLPRWRGASPLQAALRAGDQTTGVSVMAMVRALDAGPVYGQRSIALDETATLPWLHDRMADEAALALADFLDQYPDVTAQEQDPALVTTCGKLTPADGQLDPACSATDLARLVRAYHPAPGCHLRLFDERLRVHAARAVATAGAALAPGATTVIDQQPAVICGQGALLLERVQPPGKRPMAGRDWLNGHELPPRLG